MLLDSLSGPNRKSSPARALAQDAGVTIHPGIAVAAQGAGRLSEQVSVTVPLLCNRRAPRQPTWDLVVPLIQYPALAICSGPGTKWRHRCELLLACN